jgi:hypothetical protein
VGNRLGPRVIVYTSHLKYAVKMAVEKLSSARVMLDCHTTEAILASKAAPISCSAIMAVTFSIGMETIDWGDSIFSTSKSQRSLSGQMLQELRPRRGLR